MVSVSLFRHTTDGARARCATGPRACWTDWLDKIETFSRAIHSCDRKILRKGFLILTSRMRKCFLMAQLKGGDVEQSTHKNRAPNNP